MRQTMRSADATISGYLYQFDLSALKILEAQTNDTPVTVEGFEDVDIFSPTGVEVIQCKYHPATTFHLRALGDAVLAMLKTYASGYDFQYTLYVYFQDGSNPPGRLSIQDLKACLTEQKRTPSPKTLRHYEAYEEHLAGFSERLRIIKGPSLEAQRTALQSALQQALSCSEQDVEDLHYSRCLCQIIELARRRQIRERAITREQFIEAVERKRVLFDRWQREFLGRERILKGQSRHIRRTGIWHPTRNCLVVAKVDDVSRWATILTELASRMTPGGSNLINHQPVTVALGGEDHAIRAVKIALIEHGIAINDGYEELEFTPELFDAAPVLNRVGASRIIHRASYSIRLARLSSLEQAAERLNGFAGLIAFDVDVPRSIWRKAALSVQVSCAAAEEVHEFIRGL